MTADLPLQFGRYEVIAPFGEGGMARAYLAVSRGPGGFNKLAVIKQILPNLASDAEFVAMFLDEARLAARLHHPNIVQTFDVVEHEGSYVLAMEYLDGLSLASIYRRIHPRSQLLETHLWILTQTLAGLHYAHTLSDYDGTPLNVVHRDVNPANVLLTFAGDVKLLDFGVAKARGALASSSEKSVKGKPAYCAPEQLQGSDADARADVFAVGVMLWEMLAGRRLNRGGTLLEVAKTRLGGLEPKIRDVVPDVDPALAAICDRAMALDREQRYPSAAEFRSELQAQLDKRGDTGMRILLERMGEAFADDRRELRKLIETRLASSPVRMPLGTTAEREAWAGGTQTSSGPTLVPALASSQAMPVVSPKSPLRSGLWVAAAVLAAAIVGASLGRTWLARKNPVDRVSAAEVSAPGEATPPPSPSVALPSLDPPAPPPESAGDVDEPTKEAPERTVDSSRVSSAKHRPVRPAKKLGHQRATPEAFAIVSAPSVAKAVAAQATVPAAPGRRAPSAEHSGQTPQPGAHLMRPATAPHKTIDEKDPYSP